MPVKEFTAHQIWCYDCGTCGIIRPEDYDRYRVYIARAHRGHKLALLRDMTIRYYRPLPGGHREPDKEVKYDTDGEGSHRGGRA